MRPLASAPYRRALLALATAPLAAFSQPPVEPHYPPGGDIPVEFRVADSSFDHERRVVEIPMRDGVKLHTVILVPRGHDGAELPILLTRAPHMVGLDLPVALQKQLELMVFGGLIIFFLIVEPQGLARLWQVTKEKLRLWPFPH